ncbi:MAG: MlaD family protein [Acidiphilium sp.]|jgi:paraquat-inducible protein B|nr:MlaD family protein [Acidiphilium sp.]
MADKSPEPPKARFRGTRWPGMIWAVPVAAAGIVIWLGLEAVAKRGPEVTVDFPTSGGLKPGSTAVKYRGVTVGHVDAVRLTKTLNTMKVTMRFMGDMKGHLGRGTSFWIAGRKVSFGNLASLKTIIAGPYIGVEPHAGKLARHFTGLTHAPVLHSGAKGEMLRIVAAHPGNLSRGAGIYFNHFKIGQVVDVAMRPDGRHFDISAFIQRAHENLVSTRSRFWNAGGVSVSTGGAGPKLELQSIPALVSGAIGVETPPGGGHPDKGTIYHLYSGRAAALSAPGPHAVPYRVILAGGPHGLKSGAKVTLEGADAGVVTKVAMRFDPDAGKLVTRVDLALEPHDVPLAAPHRWHLADPAPQMNAMLSTLIGQGLRARMDRATPVIGAQTIALDLVKHAPAATLGTGTVPEIPSTTATSVKAIMAQVSEILANVHDATSRIAAVSRSPRTKRTLERLDRTITHVDAITRTTSAQLPQLLASLRQSMHAADAALRSVHGLVAQQGTAANAPESESLPRALYELTRAARSLRELTDYLSGHPNAIIFGKGR